jgi:hypothetical protein
MKVRQPKAQRLRSDAHRRAPKQEAEAASRLSAATVRGSGSGWEKGDVRLRGILRLECKTTLAKSFPITREMVAKIEAAALPTGEVPAIEIEFIDPGGKVAARVCVVPSYVLQALCPHP